MVVCRYFQEGRCKFGERCYNDHVRYSERPRYESPNRNARYAYDDAGYQAPRNSFNSYDNSFYENNPYQWRSSRYDSYSSNAPRRKDHSPPPPPKAKFGEPKHVHSATESNQIEEALLRLIQEDMTTWVEGKIWPFTCYSFQKERGCVPGFDDTSPEELRYEAYKSFKDNSFSDYEKRIASALALVNRKREFLKKQPHLAFSDTQESSKQEEMCIPSNQFFGNSSNDNTKQTLFGKPAAVTSSFSGNAFSLGHLSSSKQEANEVESMNEDSASDFSRIPSSASTFKFVLPVHEETNSSVVCKASAGEQDFSLYTPLEDLTQEELDAFSASTFALGKIPTKPPPKTMCM